MFVKVQDGAATKYPYTVGQLRRDNPNTSFPKNVPDHVLADYGVYRVVEANGPAYNDKTQRIQISELPELIDGVWTLTKTVVDLTAEQIEGRNQNAASINREKRNQLLADTDHYGLSDVTMSPEMAAYRQALRDITDHVNWPHLSDIDFPVKP